MKQLIWIHDKFNHLEENGQFLREDDIALNVKYFSILLSFNNLVHDKIIGVCLL